MQPRSFGPHSSLIFTQYEAVPESLKNVVLVMNAADILVPPPSAGEDRRTERQRALWDATHERIERFLPGFLPEVVPAPPPPTPPQAPVAAQTAQETSAPPPASPAATQ